MKVTASSSTARLLALGCDPSTLSRLRPVDPSSVFAFGEDATALSMPPEPGILLVVPLPVQRIRRSAATPFARTGCPVRALRSRAARCGTRCANTSDGLARRTSVALGIQFPECWKATSHPCKRMAPDRSLATLTRPCTEEPLFAYIASTGVDAPHRSAGSHPPHPNEFE